MASAPNTPILPNILLTHPSRNNTSPLTRWTKVRDPAMSPPLHPPANPLITAHPAEIFSLAPTATSLLSASGSSVLRVHSTTTATFPLQQTIPDAHKLGCHHVCTARGGAGTVAASVGFGGDIKIWRLADEWQLDWHLPPGKTAAGGGDVWAVALSADEGFLACTTSDGRIHVWDLGAKEKIQTYETGARGGGSFAMAVDLSRDGRLTASGHESGGVYVFNNDAGRMVYSLSGGLPLYRL